MATMTEQTTATASIYNVPTPPEDVVAQYAAGKDPSAAAKDPSGFQAPLGAVLANVAAPFFLYTQMKGKAALWDRLLGEVPEAVLRDDAALDVGCGRGLTMLKIAERKAALHAPAKAYGLAMGNDDAHVPAANAVQLGVAPYAAVHAATWSAPLPFADAAFGLVAASLALHLAPADLRAATMQEMIRVTKPGGRLVVVDLMGYCGALRDLLLAAGWPAADISLVWAGPGIMFGMWPAHILTATAPDKK